MCALTRIALLLMFIFTARASAQASSLDSMPGVSIERFPVKGSTAREVRAYLRESGPLGEDGGHYDAYTQWSIRWHWPVEANEPQFAELRVETDIRVILPQWTAPSEALQESWDNYIERVEEHEAGHVRQARYHAKKIEQSLRKAYESMPNLTAAQANAIARKILVEARNTDELYDSVTSHGRLQGAKWP